TRSAPRSASVGSVRQRRSSPSAPPIAEAIFVPPMSSATTAVAALRVISAAIEHDRAGEEAGVIGIDPPSRRKLLNGAVDPDKARERVAPTTHDACSRDRYLIVDTRLGAVKDPYQRSLAGD